MEEEGGPVRFQNFRIQGEEYRNVIAFFGPDTGARIIVGAHYDAAKGTPGADDNASGGVGLFGFWDSCPYAYRYGFLWQSPLSPSERSHRVPRP
ncbi:MAG: M28 family peptidase [Flavobacteriales bacterium]